MQNYKDLWIYLKREWTPDSINVRRAKSSEFPLNLRDSLIEELSERKMFVRLTWSTWNIHCKIAENESMNSRNEIITNPNEDSQ